MSLSAFPPLIPEYREGRYSVLWNEQKITVYTDRSAARDIATFIAAYQSVKPGHKLLIIAPWYAGLTPLFKDAAEFIFIAPVRFEGQQAPADQRIIATDDALQNFVNTIAPDDKFEIFAAPQWGAAQTAILESTKKILENAAIRLKTIRHFERLWQINFRVNSPLLDSYGDIAELKKLPPPGALVMAGPTLDINMQRLAGITNLWCADTALPALIAHQIYPQVVFSVDAGFASREHFCGLKHQLRQHRIILVCDLLGNPSVQRLPFSRVLTYAGSHPLLQNLFAEWRPDLTPLENPKGDVGSLMHAAYTTLFGSPNILIMGHDGGPRRRITHARGTAYFFRTFAAQTRMGNIETYMLKLSRRY